MREVIWKLKKLPAMGPAEILGRIGGAVAQWRERLEYRAGRFDWPPHVWRRRLCRYEGAQAIAAEDLPQWWLRHMRQREEPAFLLDGVSLQESVTLYDRLFGARRESLLNNADRICSGRFSFLGIEFTAEDPVAWQQDPKTKQDWPPRFYADVRIPFCDGAGSAGAAGDVKHVWELNRHEFLLDCAKAFRLTGRSDYARRVFAIIASWVRANPYLQGVNWAGPLEVAVRALTWLWVYQFCRDWDGLTPEVHLDVIKSFYRHGAYLYRHLEVYTSPNNHLVGEATALYLLGCFFPEFDQSRAWQERGWDVLAAEPERQFFADGGSTEQSTSYHHYCLGFFFLAVLTRLRQKQPVHEAMLRRLEAACEYSMWMTTPDGTVPRIGDGDDARSIRFGSAPHWDFRNVLSIGATLFARADMKAVAGSFSEDALWLLGPVGYDAFQRISPQSPSAACRVFPDSGYAVLRSGWGDEDHHLCFDCGPIGRGLHAQDIPAFTHGHADMLSLTLSAFGKPLLVDAGFYTFNGSPDWHRYCREVQGHNTVRVDGASQAKLSVANHWSCAAVPGPIVWQSGAKSEFVQGSHSGFYGIEGKVCHRRAIFWKRNSYWLILDRLEGQGAHFVEVFFHFAPGSAQLLPEGSGVRIETDDHVHAVLMMPDSRPLSAEVKSGGAGPEDGWIATSYGCRTAAPVVRFYGRLRLPASLAYVLMPSRCECEELRLQRLTCADDESYRIYYGSSADVVDLSSGRPMLREESLESKSL